MTNPPSRYMPSCQRPADDGDTLATVKSSDVSSYGGVSQHSSLCGSLLSRASSDEEVRERYLRRLGINASPCKSAGGPSPSSSSLTSLSRSSSSQDKIILLRYSRHYTTALKSDPSERTEDVSNGAGGRDNDPTPPSISPPFGFDLSAAWASLLSKDRSSEASTSKDGAYDLFSLPGRPLDGVVGRKVSFDATVQATTIPSRQSYSERMRRQIWGGAEDVRAPSAWSEREHASDYHGCQRQGHRPCPLPPGEVVGVGDAHDEECSSGVFDMDLE